MGRPTKENFTHQTGCNCSIDHLSGSRGRICSGSQSCSTRVKHQTSRYYKCLDGNAELQWAVALTVWQYLTHCQQQTNGITDLQELFCVSACATRNFARPHPARYRVMVHYRMRPAGSEEAEVMQNALQFFQASLHLQSLKHDALIDVIRMVNAAIYGFIIREQFEFMTIDRSIYES